MRFVLQFFVSFYVFNIGHLISDTTSNPNVAGEEDSREVIMDPQAEHTFVTLLDIVFTDGSKRTCTGTIIHESVVLTAAHCFTNPDNESAKPELLASFVVIGTKKMFSTGYEHYLPIEKILIHPKYRGWTADLALVYTFASMTGHKPGTILPLAGERTSTHVDANVTVLSWGSSELVDDVWKKYGSKVASDCDSDDDDKDRSPSRIRSPGLQTMLPYNMNIGLKDSEESETVFKSRRDKKKTKHALRSDPPSMREEKAKRYLGIDEDQINVITTEDDLAETLQSNEEVVNDNDFVTEPAFLADENTSSKHTSQSKNKYQSKNILPESVYGKRRSGIEEWPQSIYVNSKRFAETMNQKESQNPYQNFRRFDQNYKGLSIYRKPEEPPQPTMGPFEIKSYYKNWRRLMGTQQNQLKVEIFGFVNQKICETMVEKVMPSEFHLGSKNDVVCFSADEQFITDEDAGASVVRQGKLIAVAIGGVRYENDHVSIGMKMSCYCSWIAENLPEPRPDMSCCYNCCDVTHLKDGVSPPQSRYEPKTKKLISF